jgi:hypothetical protein
MSGSEFELDQPFVLFVSKRFIDSAKKPFDLGLVVRKPLLKMLQGLNVGFTELDRDEVKRRIDEVASSKGMTISTGDMIKRLSLSMLTPTALVIAAKKKVTFLSAADLGDSLIAEFVCEIPRAFRPSLIYFAWLVVPRSRDGGARALQVFKAIAGKVASEPITDEEWDGAEPARKTFAESGVKGSEENLWRSL